MQMFWTDSVVLPCSDVNATMDWWIRHFDCKRVPVPSDWDSTLPSDVALQLPGNDHPTILLSAQAEVDEAGVPMPENPILFTSHVKRAREYLIARGLAPSAIAESGGALYFDLSDGLGHTVEICQEP
ncbi:MAG: hypothetical protein KIT83_13920 [Bryobacterales bacterium]|nr:hypothetical protein [Bryobacterales bacterium]